MAILINEIQKKSFSFTSGDFASLSVAQGWNICHVVIQLMYLPLTFLVFKIIKNI